MKLFFRNHPLEAVAGLVGAAVAVAGFMLSGQADWIGVTGTTLSVLGAALASIVAASVFGLSKAEEQLVQRLRIARNHLATASSQISGALVAMGAGRESEETGAARIDQALSTVSTSIHTLNDICGDATIAGERAGILEGKRDIVLLGQQLDEIKDQFQSEVVGQGQPTLQFSTELLSRFEEAQDQVSKALASLASAEGDTHKREVVQERVECPTCAHINNVPIGNRIGDSASPTCSNCGEQFHAHMGSDGPFARAYGGSHGGTPRSVLGRHSMVLPEPETRRQYLDTIKQAHADGRLGAAHDVTNVVDDQHDLSLPSRVRMPLFYALVNKDYGIIELEDDPGPLRERRVTSFHECDCGDFTGHADAAWLAQALHRLWGYEYTDEQLAKVAFGTETLSPYQQDVLRRAKAFARRSIEESTDDGVASLRDL